MKKCTACGEDKPLTEYWRRGAGTQARCKECCLAYKRGRHRTVRGRARQLWDSARIRAASTGREFTLTIEEIEAALQEGTCHATGLPFDMAPAARPGARNPYAPSLDRVDSSLGYTPENTRLVVWAFNAMRNEFGDDVLDTVFRAWKETSCEPC